MKTVHVSEMTDEQWKMYARLEEDLERKYNAESKKIKKENWEDLKRERLHDLETLKDDLLEFYLFFEDNKANGWLGVRLIQSSVEFIFDALFDEVPDYVMDKVLEIVRKFSFDAKRDEVFSYSNRPPVIKALLDSGGTLYDRKIFARLKRDEIDIDELRKTVDSISGKINYKLVLYDTIDEEILDRYVDIYNDARVDMNRYNPNKPEMTNRTREDVLKKLKWDKGPRDKMFLYVLFDNENIAAFCSLFIRDENKHMVDQAGGLTTVGRNYRGQNLAKFLKAKMYIKMLEEYPEFEFIRTDTYPWNKYMYRINEEMGFKSYDEYCEIRFLMNNE